MKKILYCLVFIIAVLSYSCSKIDNYDEPAETLKGVVIDKAIQKPLQTEVGTNGIRIKLLEYSWSDDPTPYYFYAMQDGSFNNTKIFKGNYNIEVEGAFVPLVQTDNAGNIVKDESITTDIKGVKELTFQVEPFLNVEWVGEPVLNPDGSATVNIKFSRGTFNSAYQQNITDVFLFVNSNPYAGNNNYDNGYSTQILYSGNEANTLVGQTVTITTKGGALPGNRTLYLRVGARIDYPIAGVKRYNYNEVKSINIP